mmetsp:Transcript_10173/g.29029  ORF Transcript_10173/g.29029 Transcript_10173/m.29029 type:complete len:214 (+) Transcript_10173:431-1072(+)
MMGQDRGFQVCPSVGFGGPPTPTSTALSLIGEEQGPWRGGAHLTSLSCLRRPKSRRQRCHRTAPSLPARHRKCHRSGARRVHQPRQEPRAPPFPCGSSARSQSPRTLSGRGCLPRPSSNSPISPQDSGPGGAPRGSAFSVRRFRGPGATRRRRGRCARRWPCGRSRHHRRRLSSRRAFRRGRRRGPRSRRLCRGPWPGRARVRGTRGCHTWCR